MAWGYAKGFVIEYVMSPGKKKTKKKRNEKEAAVIA